MREERQLQFFVLVARLRENPFEKLLGIRSPVLTARPSASTSPRAALRT
jgi:hypothetical protein